MSNQKNRKAPKKGSERKRSGKQPQRKMGTKSGLSAFQHTSQFGRGESGAYAPHELNADLRWGFDGNGATSASYGETVFSGNNLFDPGLGSSATQPIGFDQYAIWYEVYRVMKSKCTIKMALVSTASAPTATALEGSFVLYANNTSSPANTLGDALAQPGAIFKQATSAKPITLVKTVTTAQITGQKPAGVADGTQAAVGGAPSEQWYWHVGSASGAAYTGIVMNLTATVEYGTRFFSRALVPLSLYAQEMKKVRKVLDAEKKRIAALPRVNTFSERKSDLLLQTEDEKSGAVSDDERSYLVLKHEAMKNHWASVEASTPKLEQKKPPSKK